MDIIALMHDLTEKATRYHWPLAMWKEMAAQIIESATIERIGAAERVSGISSLPATAGDAGSTAPAQETVLHPGYVVVSSCLPTRNGIARFVGTLEGRAYAAERRRWRAAHPAKDLPATAPAQTPPAGSMVLLARRLAQVEAELRDIAQALATTEPQT